MTEDDFKNGVAVWDASQNLSRVWSILFIGTKSMLQGNESSICDELTEGVSIGRLIEKLIE